MREMQVFHCIVEDHLYIANAKQDKDSDDVHYFSTSQFLSYEPFCDDFGPMNLASIVRFIVHLQENVQKHPNKKIVYFVEQGRRPFTNGVLLIGAYMLVVLKMSPEEVWERFVALESQILEPYRDASFLPADFALHLIDCWRAIRKAMNLKWFALPAGSPLWGKFDIQEYEHFEDPWNADLVEVVPRKFVAFKGPKDLGDLPFQDVGAIREFSPLHYLETFEHLHVTTVIRLNEAMYDKSLFEQHGIRLFDLEFEDCSTPSPAIIADFLRIASASAGLVAVHCKAGLGRTGTLIALHMMRHHDFSAREAIAWLRIMRSGSVIGEQQQFLCDMEPHFRPAAALTNTPRAETSPRPAPPARVPAATVAAQVSTAMDRRVAALAGRAATAQPAAAAAAAACGGAGAPASASGPSATAHGSTAHGSIPAAAPAMRSINLDVNPPSPLLGPLVPPAAGKSDADGRDPAADLLPSLTLLSAVRVVEPAAAHQAAPARPVTPPASSSSLPPGGPPPAASRSQHRAAAATAPPARASAARADVSDSDVDLRDCAADRGSFRVNLPVRQGTATSLSESGSESATPLPTGPAWLSWSASLASATDDDSDLTAAAAAAAAAAAVSAGADRPRSASWSDLNSLFDSDGPHHHAPAAAAAAAAAPPADGKAHPARIRTRSLSAEFSPCNPPFSPRPAAAGGQLTRRGVGSTWLSAIVASAAATPAAPAAAPPAAPAADRPPPPCKPAAPAGRWAAPAAEFQAETPAPPRRKKETLSEVAAAAIRATVANGCRRAGAGAGSSGAGRALRWKFGPL